MFGKWNYNLITNITTFMCTAQDCLSFWLDIFYGSSFTWCVSCTQTNSGDEFICWNFHSFPPAAVPGIRSISSALVCDIKYMNTTNLSTSTSTFTITFLASSFCLRLTSTRPTYLPLVLYWTAYQPMYNICRQRQRQRERERSPNSLKNYKLATIHYPLKKRANT